MLLLLKNLLFTLAVPGTFAVLLPLLIARGRSAASGLALAFAIALFVIGGAIYSWCVWDFATFGRGTPAPIDAPKRLVVRGLYRYARNPMYVGVLTVVLAWAVVFRSVSIVLYALGAFVMFNLMIRFYEEPHLRRAFGPEYDDYCARVNRWLPIWRGKP